MEEISFGGSGNELPPPPGSGFIVYRQIPVKSCMLQCPADTYPGSIREIHG